MKLNKFILSHHDKFVPQNISSLTSNLKEFIGTLKLDSSIDPSHYSNAAVKINHSYFNKPHLLSVIIQADKLNEVLDDPAVISFSESYQTKVA